MEVLSTILISFGVTCVLGGAAGLVWFLVRKGEAGKGITAGRIDE